MRKKRNVLERVVYGADLMTEPLPKLPLIELVGEHRLLIENHMGVTEYGLTEISVKVTYGQLSICGEGLEMARMTKEQLVITGSIDSIRIYRRGN